jgi:hypothetical protein
MGSGKIEIFLEGVISNDAKKRIKLIKDKFESGFLDLLIYDLKDGKTIVDLARVSPTTQVNLRQLVDLLTSEVGRALIGLTVMQLSIKAISPEQSIRLHKASSNKGSFSWVEGISMRTLDKNYVTPTLRRHDLVRLNSEIDKRINELSDLHGIDLKIISYDEWVELMFERCIDSSLIDEQTLSQEWIKAYVLTLSQRKRAIAPIDEPCMEWIRLLKTEIQRI